MIQPPPRVPIVDTGLRTTVGGDLSNNGRFAAVRLAVLAVVVATVGPMMYGTVVSASARSNLHTVEFGAPPTDERGHDRGEADSFSVGRESSGSSGGWGRSAGSDNGGPNTDGYPSYESTGPRVAPIRTSSSITTSHDGQIIERVTVNGNIEIHHNNVVVRDVVVMGTGNYAIDIGKDTTSCPTGVLIEYTEVNMIDAPADASMPVFARCGDGGVTLDHLRIHNTARPVRTAGNFVMTNSWVYSARTYPGAHRTALSTHGGSNFVVVRNTFICELDGCSSAVNMYSDHEPVTNYLFEGNLVAGGSICLRAGETHEYPDDTQDIRIINNHFSTVYYPECGQHQAIAQFDESAPGNVRYGNVFHESGLPVPGG